MGLCRRSRRWVVVAAVVMAGWAGGGAVEAGGEPAGTMAARSRPHIVIVYADDLGIGDVSCYNRQSKIPTPNIDRLAAEGMRFTDAHSGHCLCSPSRYSLLTGRYSWRGPLTRGIVWHWDKPVIEPGRLTMASMLKAAGYRTYGVGKWHLGWNWPSPDDPAQMRKNQGAHVDFTQPITGGPTALGFDYYFGEDVINLPPFIWIENERCLKVPTRTVRSYAAGPGTDDWDPMAVLPTNTNKCLEIIDRQKSQAGPFFLYYAMPSPHSPHVPSPAFRGRTSLGDYGDYVCQTDDALGRIVTALKRAGLWQRTLLVFTSDNGSPELKLQAKGHRTNGIYRGRKHENWEGGYRIPMIVTWPGRVRAGAVNGQLVSQIDLLATFAQVLGVALPAGSAEDSRSMLATLADPSAPVREELVQINNGGQWALRKGDWKYFENTSDMWLKKKNMGPALFNLSGDPAEQRNLIDQYPDKAAELKARLMEYKQQHARAHAAGSPASPGGRRARP